MKTLILLALLPLTALAQEDLIDNTKSPPVTQEKQSDEIRCMSMHLDRYYKNCRRYPKLLNALTRATQCNDGKPTLTQLPEQAKTWIYKASKDGKTYELKPNPKAKPVKASADFLKTCKVDRE